MGREQKPRPSLAAQRFEKQSRPSAVAVSQIAKDTKGDNQEAHLLFFCFKKMLLGDVESMAEFFLPHHPTLQSI